ERRPYNTAPGRLCEDLGGVVITQAALARRLTTIALAAALAAGLAASGRPALGQGGAIRIGAVFAVTGPASSLGKPEKDTAAMLAAQLAASGGVAGRPVQIITYDSETDPTKAVLLMKKAVTEDGVAAVVGGTTSPESQPMADYAMSAEIPFMSVAASTTLSVPAHGRDRGQEHPPARDAGSHPGVPRHRQSGVHPAGRSGGGRGGVPRRQAAGRRQTPGRRPPEGAARAVRQGFRSGQ